MIKFDEFSNDLVNVRTKLKKLRKENFGSRKKLSAVTGISEAIISDYETGRSKISLELMMYLADVFNVNVSALLGEQVSKNPKHNEELIIISKRLAPLYCIGILGDEWTLIHNTLFKDPHVLVELNINSFTERSTPFSNLTAGIRGTPEHHKFILELLKLTNSLIRIDHVITVEENLVYNTIKKYLISTDENFTIQDRKELLRAQEKTYYGNYENVSAVMHRRLLIWILFFIAYSDGILVKVEEEFIYNVTRNLKLDDNFFNFVKNQIESHINKVISK